MNTSTPANDVYVEAEPESAVLPTKVFQAELRAINDRRRNMGLSPVAADEDAGPLVQYGLVGICLSGGGIRSSTFNLGVLQSLDRTGLFRYADYLSTVSGGGYIGSCLSSVFAGAATQEKKDVPLIPFPFRHEPGQPESQSFKHLRDYANYLKPPRLFASLRLPGLMLRGLLINFLIILPLLLLLVIGTVLVAKNNIRDALNTTTFQYTLNNQSSKISHSTNPSEYKRVTIDLRSHIQWIQHENNFNILVKGVTRDLSREKVKRIDDATWFLENYSHEQLSSSPLVFEPHSAPKLQITSWPVKQAENGPTSLLSTFIHKIKSVDFQQFITLFPALFDAQQIVVKYDDTVEDKKTQITLGDYVGWKKYIILAGLPKNSYSDSGKFLDDGRWLFEGSTADNLKLEIYIPDIAEDRTIDVRAWQTRDADYFTVQDMKKHISLLYNGQLTTKSWYGADTENSTTTFSSLPTTIKLSEILQQCNFQWDENKGDHRYLSISDLPQDFEPSSGDRLPDNSWIFTDDQIENIDIILSGEMVQKYTAANPLLLTVWQSGKDDKFDPVTLIWNNTFDITKWLTVVFFSLLLLFPLIQGFLRLCGLPPWKRRDLLTRYLCGGGIALLSIFAFLELQPLAIYLFYYLKKSLDVAGIIEDTDQILALTGTIATLGVGIFSSKAMGSGAKLNTKFGLYTMGILGPAVLWIFYLNLCGWALNPENIPEMLIRIKDCVLTYFLIAAVITFFISRLFYNVNQTSIHPFYRDRLSKAFLFTINEETKQVQHNDGQKLQSLETHNGPYHLINTTLNINGNGNVNLQGRHADFFIFSKEYTGSQLTGYCRTGIYEERDKHIGLATAMAISAAAAAPNMGKMTQKSLVFVMTMLNIRLGYWAQNPRKIHKRKKYHRVRPVYLLKEMLGLVNEKSNCLNISDGGHLENLGLYELVRRRCKYIIIGDAEADKKMTFNGLAEAIRMIRIDMGICIDIDLHHIYRKNGTGSKHYAMGTIRYEDGQTGYLLYIKSSVSGNHNPYIKDYMARNSDFPHESTADQFFNEAQFEAYRALGVDVAKTVWQDEEGQQFLKAVMSECEAGQI